PVAMVKADQVKVPHDVRRKLRDGDAIEVGDHRQEDRQPDDLVEDAAGGEGRGTIEHGRRRSRWVGQLRPIAHYVSLAPDNRFFICCTRSMLPRASSHSYYRRRG